MSEFDQCFCPVTPAMAAIVADRQWTFDELRAYPVACQRNGDIDDLVEIDLNKRTPLNL